MFKASCDQHDFYYWRGGDQELRKKVDGEFLQAMLHDSKNYFHKWWAYLYYYGVRFGTVLDKFKKKKFWYYGESRDRKQLNNFMASRVSK
jgi:hypothetical protein